MAQHKAKAELVDGKYVAKCPDCSFKGKPKTFPQLAQLEAGNHNAATA